MMMLSLFTAGCKKDDPVAVSGEITLDSKLYGTGPYFAYGFLFSQAKKVSTLSKTPPDITVLAETDVLGNIAGAAISTASFLDSFMLIGEFSSEQEALEAFSSLKSIPSTGWVGLAESVKPFALYGFRTRSEKSAKFLVLNVIAEERDNLPYAGVTLKWAYQPDGTNIFP